MFLDWFLKMKNRALNVIIGVNVLLRDKIHEELIAKPVLSFLTVIEELLIKFPVLFIGDLTKSLYIKGCFPVIVLSHKFFIVCEKL